jgi:hypothetical protein
MKRRERSTKWDAEKLLNTLMHSVFVLRGEGQNVKRLDYLAFGCQNLLIQGHHLKDRVQDIL